MGLNIHYNTSLQRESETLGHSGPYTVGLHTCGDNLVELPGGYHVKNCSYCKNVWPSEAHSNSAYSVNLDEGRRV